MTVEIAPQHDEFIFEGITIEEELARGTAKWTTYGPEVLPAPVAEMDFPLAPVIREALIAAIRRGAAGYPPRNSGLEQAASAWLARDFGVAVPPERIKIIPSVLKGLEVAIEALSRPESPVVIPTPSYPPFFMVTRGVGREIIEAPMQLQDGVYSYNLDAIEDGLKRGAGTVILCNPYNPVGRSFSRAELMALAQLVERYGASVVADEVHAPLLYPGVSFTSYSTVSEAAANHSVTLISASKGWNVAGLKCAQIGLTAEADLEAWGNVNFLKTHGASTPGILANRVAYEEGVPWLRACVDYLDGNRFLLRDLLADLLPEIGYTPPQGTYLAWLDCRALGLENPAAFFLEKAKVALNDGSTFGPPGQGFVRLNFATSRAILTEIVQRMAAAVRARP